MSCSEPQATHYTPPSNIQSLIAGDYSKVWMLAKRFNGKVRMNMEGCFLTYRQKFYKNKIVHDTNGEQANCGETLIGLWELTNDRIGNHYIKIRSEQYKRLMGRDSGFVEFKILYASKDSLTLSFIHNQFGTVRRITDHFVTEDVVILDRDFHW